MTTAIFLHTTVAGISKRWRLLTIIVVMAFAGCSSPHSETPATDAQPGAAVQRESPAAALDAARMCPPYCENFPEAGIESYLTQAAMEQVRTAAWQRLVPFANRSEGLPDPQAWTPIGSVFPEGSTPPPPGASVPLRPEPLKIDLVEQPSPLAVSRLLHPLPVRYESTFFNNVARQFVTTTRLNERETTTRLEQDLKREIAFPTGSMALKTFWYPIRGADPIYPQVWDWKKIQTLPSGSTLPIDFMPQQCVMVAPTQSDCLPAQPTFYTVAVTDAIVASKVFSCGTRCQGHQLQKGDVMVLIGLHIMSKQTPDWLWATFWWRGRDDQTGQRLGRYWTCQNAQRPQSITSKGEPWTNYSMDATASFKYRKPIARKGEPCGAPPRIGVSEEYAAAYNPFVEASLANGLKSNCVHCHAKASTSSNADRTVPSPRVMGAASLDMFEGHIRLDYLWSVRRGLSRTDWPFR